MEKQNEQKYAELKKRHSWLAAANWLLFIAICVSVAFLTSILKRHASNDADAIPLVPEGISQNELLASNQTSTDAAQVSQEAAAIVLGNKGTSGGQSTTNTNPQQVIDQNSLKNENGSNVPMEVGVTYRDEVVTVPMNPSIQVYDDAKVWETNTEVDIFKIRYENGEAKVTVDGGGDKVIAPGTDNAYTFYLKNTGDVELDYTLNMEAYFTPADVQIPVEVKLKGYDGSYLVGDENNWIDVLALNGIEDNASIEVNRYAYYTLEWQWPYESGNDAFDTYLGNRAVDEDLTLTIVIKTVATGDDSRTEVVRVPVISWIPKTGDQANVLLWAGLLVVSACMLGIILWVKRREKDEADEEN